MIGPPARGFPGPETEHRAIIEPPGQTITVSLCPYLEADNGYKSNATSGLVWGVQAVGLVSVLSMPAVVTTQESKTLSLATEPNLSTIEFCRGRELVGFDIDLIKAIGEDDGV